MLAPPPTPPGHLRVRTREIGEADHEAMAEFLGKSLGYPAGAYLAILRILKDHNTPQGFPKYGYLLEAGGAIAGGILMIFSAVRGEDGPYIRCHLTAWCVDPVYRSYASMFSQRALRHQNVTYLNLSARPATVPIVEAQGFQKFSAGQFATIPVLGFRPRKSDARVVAPEAAPEELCDPCERKLLLDHQSYGCVSFWCLTQERAYPFVFQPRKIKRVLPGAQLIYCRDVSDLARFSGPAGVYLASRRIFAVSIDACGPIKGLPGRYFDGVQPRWYRGTKPRLGDLAYTLPAMYPPSG
jgi:hypothetical protein